MFYFSGEMADSSACRLSIDWDLMDSDDCLSTAQVLGGLSNTGKRWLSSRLASCWEAAIVKSRALTYTVVGASLAELCQIIQSRETKAMSRLALCSYLCRQESQDLPRSMPICTPPRSF